MGLFKNIINGVGNAFSTVSNTVVSGVTNLVNGVVSGVTNNVATVVKSVAPLVKDVVNSKAANIAAGGLSHNAGVTNYDATPQSLDNITGAPAQGIVDKIKYFFIDPLTGEVEWLHVGLTVTVVGLGIYLIGKKLRWF